MSQVLKAAQSTGHGYLFFSSSFRIPWLYPPYTPSGVEGASKCCSSSGGVIGENVAGAAATIPGGEAGGVPGGVRGDLHGGVRGGVSGGVPGGVPGQVLGKSTGKVHADLSMAV